LRSGEKTALFGKSSEGKNDRDKRLKRGSVKQAMKSHYRTRNRGMTGEIQEGGKKKEGGGVLSRVEARGTGPQCFTKEGYFTRKQYR